MESQDNSDTTVTLVTLHHTYILTPYNNTVLAEACTEVGPHVPHEMVTGRPLTSLRDQSPLDDELWEMSVEEEGPFLPQELAA